MILQSIDALTIAGCILVGLVLALPKTIRPALAERLGLSTDQSRVILSSFYIALVPFAILGGICVDTMSSKGVLEVGSLLIALGVFMLAISDSFARALGASLILSAGWACLAVSVTVLMPRAFFEGNPTASLSLGYLLIGLGSILVPGVVDLLVKRLDLHRGLGVLAVFCLMPSLIAVFTQSDAFPAQDEPAQVSVVMSHPSLWLAALAFFFYSAIEGSLDVWDTDYLNEIGVRDRRRQVFEYCFWLMFLVGRLGAMFLFLHILKLGVESWALLFLALAIAVVLGNMAGASERANASAGYLFVGLFLGPIFPLLVATLFNRFEDAQRGTAFGAMFSVGILGQILGAPLVATYIKKTSVRRAMRIPIISGLLLGLMALVMGLIRI